MRPLRITNTTLRVIAAWRAGDPDSARRTRVHEVVEALENGSWDLPLWHYIPLPADPDVIMMRPGYGIQILFHIVRSEPTMEEAADFTAIDVDERYNKPFGEAGLSQASD